MANYTLNLCLSLTEENLDFLVRLEAIYSAEDICDCKILKLYNELIFCLMVANTGACRGMIYYIVFSPIIAATPDSHTL